MLRYSRTLSLTVYDSFPPHANPDLPNSSGGPRLRTRLALAYVAPNTLLSSGVNYGLLEALHVLESRINSNEVFTSYPSLSKHFVIKTVVEAPPG